MMSFFEQFAARLWNHLQRRKRGAWHEEPGRLTLGFQVVDGQVTKRRVSVNSTQRTMHTLLVGVPGVGKSSELLNFAGQDIDTHRGFLFLGPHGDMAHRLLLRINTRERRERRHLSDRLVLVDPADPIVSIGLNPLEQDNPDFVRTAEMAEIIRSRCGLGGFGVRIQETLTNGLYSLSANKLTLVELPLLLTNADFRRTCMKQVQNVEVRQYFEERYDKMSPGMQAATRDPVLNKISSFIADPHYRQIVGQPSTFVPKSTMDEGYWVIADLPKSKLGTHVSTLGSLIFTTFKNALFTRENRSLFSIYIDELKNFVGSDIETALTEGRKFSTPIVAACQTLAQLSPELRSALFAVGTQIFFRLSANDAAEVAQALDGGRSLAERLKNLPQRHAIVKLGAERWVEIAVPRISDPEVDYTDLLNRTRYTRGRVRAHIERDIAKRQAAFMKTPDEVLDGWE